MIPIDYEGSSAGGVSRAEERGFSREINDVVAEAYLWRDGVLKHEHIRNSDVEESARLVLKRPHENSGGGIKLLAPGRLKIEELPEWVDISEFHRQKRIFHF